MLDYRLNSPSASIIIVVTYCSPNKLQCYFERWITKLLLHVITRMYVQHLPHNRRSQWPRGLRRRSSAARLLRLWVRIPPGAWMFVCCECCLLSGRGLCDGLITRPEESYRMWRVVVCDHETSQTRWLKPATGLSKYNHTGL